MDIERLLVSRIAMDQSMDAVLARDLEATHFLQRAKGDTSPTPLPGEVYGWMCEHLRKFNAVPSFGLTKMRWPFFEFIDSGDPIEALATQMVAMVKRRALIEGIRDLSSIADDPTKWEDAEIHAFEVAANLSRIVPSSTVTRLSDSINRLRLHREMQATGRAPGITLVGPDLDALTYGGQPGELMIWQGFLGAGKAQPLDAKIRTPQGWIEMGSAAVGDTVIGADGGEQRITAIFPRGKRQVYRVTFTDGTSTECCDEHLWSLKNLSDRKTGADWRTLQLKDVMNDLRYPSGQAKWYAPMPEPVKGRYVDVLLDPYIMGLLLGGGNFRSSTPSFTTADDELRKAMIDNLPEGMTLTAKGRYGWSITADVGVAAQIARGDTYTRPRAINQARKAIIEYELDGKLSHQKFVPQDYMVGNMGQRLALLQGLMDTGGNVSGTCAGEFCSTSKMLAEQVVELARSLGGKASIVERQTHYTVGNEKVAEKPSWAVSLVLARGLNPFRLRRKAERYSAEPRSLERIIESVEPTSVTETQCIMVSNDDHLYVTDDFVVTHNSTLSMVQSATEYAMHDKTSLVLSLEMEGQKMANRWDAAMAGFKYRSLKFMEMRDGDYEMWARFAERAHEARFEKDVLVVDDIYRCTSERIFAEVERWQPDFFIVDTIDEIVAPSYYKSHWEKQDHAARELKGVCRTTKKFGIGVAQAGREAEMEGAQLGNVAGSITINRKADLVVGLHCTPEMKRINKLELRMLKNRDGEGDGLSFAYYRDPATLSLRPWTPADGAPPPPARATSPV